MKKKYLLFILCLLMFFCVNIDGAFAREAKDVTASSGDSAGNGLTREVTRNGYVICNYEYWYREQVADVIFRLKYDMSIGAYISDKDGNFVIDGPVARATMYNTKDVVYFKNKEIPIGNKQAFTGTDRNITKLFYSSGTWKCPTDVFGSKLLKPAFSDPESIYAQYLSPGIGIIYQEDVFERDALNVKWKFVSDTSLVVNEKKAIYGMTDSGITNAEQTVEENGAETSEELADGYGLDNAVDVSDINEWGGIDEKTSKYEEVDPTDACNIINSDIKDLINQIFTIISIVGIIAVIGLTIFNLIGVVTGSEDDGLPKFFKKLKVRIISLVVLLLLPTIVSFVVQAVNGAGNLWGIKSDNPVCNINASFSNEVQE